MKILLIRSQKERVREHFCLDTFSPLWCLLSLHFHVWPTPLPPYLSPSQHNTKLQMQKIVTSASSSTPVQLVLFLTTSALSISVYLALHHQPPLCNSFNLSLSLPSFILHICQNVSHTLSSHLSHVSSSILLLLLFLLSVIPSDNPFLLPSLLYSRFHFSLCVSVSVPLSPSISYYSRIPACGVAWCLLNSYQSLRITEGVNAEHSVM